MGPKTPAAASRRRRTTVTQRISADPTSIALLLAGPTAFELWPGVRRVTEVGGRVVVETDLAPDRLTAASVRALPPRRTPTSYVSRFAWVGPGLPDTEAVLTLDYATADDGNAATSATLVLVSSGVEVGALDDRALEAMARGFLLNLAQAAQARSRAA